MSIDTTFPGSAGLGSTDPWSTTVKSISILYTYGTNETRVFASMVNRGVFNQTNAYFSTATAPGSGLIPSISPPAGSNITIQALAYGPAQVTIASTFTNIYAVQAAKSSFPIENSYFGIDTIPGTVKSAVLFYTDAAKNQLALVGREHVYLSFP
ncbi:hypothetical protein BDZ85DRAFT_259720 [Elsinoe ampelina]|uniref:Uncharacterized protein n=1 Tax=Elsinoe ampelina TaxID=302913 RepID=A0A6A6GHG0_9PEZI|nr:hypothetical protein BDZ85DRAFT_259720 [Elsinoe ampelina]